jgi:hypothetical protein
MNGFGCFWRDAPGGDDVITVQCPQHKRFLINTYA